MNYELRPPRRGLLPNLSPEVINHFARVEHTVFTKADPATAWKIFSDISLWPRFFNLYGNIRWQGTPWTPGSRLRIEINQPIQAVVDRVITVCMPPQHIAWINHVRGYTMEQWISIDPYQGGGTRISTWIEVTGADVSLRQSSDLDTLQTIVGTWFTNFALECDRVADSEGKKDIRRSAD